MSDVKLLSDYSGNSHKSKQKEKTEKERATKVIKGTAKIKKKSEIQKFASIFISEDVPNMKDYIINDIIIPAIRKTMWDIVTGGADMLFGDGRRTSKNTNRADKVSFRDYRSMSTNSSRDFNSPRRTYEYDDLTLTSKEEAIAILNQLDEMIEQYDKVSVLDYYDLAGVTMDQTADNYGWTDIRDARIIRTKDGYVIKFPKVKPIND